MQQANVPSYLLEILDQCLEIDADNRPLPRVILNTLSNHKIPTLPFFLKDCNVKVNSLKYSGMHCMEKALNSDSNSPDLFYLQQIAFTA